ncbi:MAG: PTS sugar transporter subunit IIA [Xanthobacteraceae bacterium]|jgi:PTS system nitrogen regulatory IIA component
MKISDFVSPAEVAVNVRADSKEQLLREMSARVAAAAGLNAGDVASAVLKREQLGSTGIGDGVAIPHTRLKTVTRPFADIVKLKHPIAFDAIDGRDVDIVVLLLLPDTVDADQLVALAAVARRLKGRDTLPRMRGAKTAADMYAAMTD